MENVRKLNILILEDNPEDVILIERQLRREKLEFVIENVDTRTEYCAAIKRSKPDVVLSDHSLPGFNSRQALQLCQNEWRGTVPFILVTGTASDEFAIACLREGADDYILKSNLARLPSAITAAIKKRRVEKLKREARHALRKQNDELLKVNRELDSFVYSVSHNLRGPVASAIGLVNIGKTENDVATLHSIFEMMASNLGKLDDTLREILEFARNARNDLQISEIDWSSLIDSTLKKLEYIDFDCRIKKSVVLRNDEPFYSDANRIGVILSNVLCNALIYNNGNSDAFLEIEIKTTPENGIIVVKDNGIGIDADILPKVFDMFYRGAEESKGAGLGLYITRETVNKLHGQVSIVSLAGSGTTVTITLPNNSQYGNGYSGEE